MVHIMESGPSKLPRAGKLEVVTLVSNVAGEIVCFGITMYLVAPVLPHGGLL